jgi:1-acyl-sn-glycerol-3-phosphate acyltransferase
MSRVITPGVSMPRRGNALKRLLGLLVLRLLGWRVVGTLPDVRQAVLIVAPHTSNMDGLVGIAALWALRLDVRFMAKHSLFRWPFGVFIRWLGGLPVRRDRSAGLVEQSVEYFRENEAFILGITPEGTRSGAQEWKSGFWQIARGADVPIIVVAFDYGTNRAVIADTVETTADYDADLERILVNYRGVKGRKQDRLSAPLKALLPNRRETD